jgi:glyoxylase I family protein
MSLQRRQLLGSLTLGLGSAMASSRIDFGQAEQTAAPSKTPAPPANKDAGTAMSGGTVREKVTGIGGLFFRAHDPAALTLWYEEHLGVSPTPTSYEMLPWQQEAGPTAFTPFAETTLYFGDASKAWMINFRVGDLDRMAAQLSAAGITVSVDPQTYPNGRFARLHDPEGNPIELWQPAGRDTPHSAAQPS